VGTADVSIQQRRGRIYYPDPDPKGRGVAVTARYLRVGHKTFAIRDLDEPGWRRGRPRTWELWARYHGTPTRLWVCENEREFKQVCRALQRAIEAHREATQY
jgi:hypothetical protein